MLVLSRKLGEQIHIGNDVVLTVVEIDRGKVRLGFVGPQNVSIDRGEVRQAKQKGPSARPERNP